MAAKWSKKPFSNNPKNEAGFISLLFFSWLNRLLKIGGRRPLEDDDLYDLSDEDKSEEIGEQIDDAWDDEISSAQVEKRQPQLWRAMLRMFSCQEYILTLLLRLLSCALDFLVVIFLWFYLKILSEQSPHQKQHALVIVAGIGVASLLRIFMYRFYNYKTMLFAMRLKIALIGCIQKKILRTKRYVLSKVTKGHIQSLISNDVQRLDEAIVVSGNLMVAPVIMVAVLISLWILIGWQSLSGVTLCILPLISGFVIAKQLKKLRLAQVALTDRRLAVISEIITGIRTVKTYAWEHNYVDMVKAVRR